MYYIGYSMSPAAEKKRIQCLNMTAVKQLAQKDKSKLYMRSFRFEMTIDKKNKKWKWIKDKRRERGTACPPQKSMKCM
jgi:hypothetical protein